MKLRTIASAALTAVMAFGLAGTATAASTNLRIQTHYGPETPSGKLAQEFFNDLSTMSNGEIKVEPFYSSSVVKSVETFDAAVSGVLDCDMTGGAYQTGKNPAFQFVGDLMGGYDTPYQQLSWLYYGGGKPVAQKLYNKYGMQLIGWWMIGQESLASTKPIRNVADFKNWKFRSPPGMETKIFEKLGAKPIVMDFTEVFTALQSGIIDGADASALANNYGMGIYDIAKHANYPGFHSMPADHLACNKAVYDKMPAGHKAILNTAMQALSLRTALTFEVKNNEAATMLRAKGVKIYNWSDEERMKYREAALAAWPAFATSAEAKELVASHQAFMKSIGLAK